MSRSTINKNYLVGDSVIINIGWGEIMSGKLTEYTGNGTFMFAKESATSMFLVSIDQILNKINTEDSLNIKFTKGTECIINNYTSDLGEEYMVSIHRITNE